MSWKEYRLQNKRAAEHLSWGGITHPNILRCKDDSVLGIITYQPYSMEEETQRIALPSFQNGWSIWIEEQQERSGARRSYLTLSWMPFRGMDGKVKNTLTGEKIEIDALEVTLAGVLRALAASFPAEAEANLLAYQEIVDYLCFTLTMGERRMEMPDPPIDLDLYLTDRLPLNFAENHVRLGDEMFLLLSLPALFGAEGELYEELWQTFAHHGIPCRHTQRILLFGEKEAEKELRSYMGKWCPSRRYIKDLLTDGLLGQLNGYYTNEIILLISKDAFDVVAEYLHRLMSARALSYVVEDYNAKDLWWGSLPGMFKAGLVPPICGFATIEDLLAVTQPAAVEEERGEAGEEEQEGEEEEIVSAEPL